MRANVLKGFEGSNCLHANAEDSFSNVLMGLIGMKQKKRFAFVKERERD